MIDHCDYYEGMDGPCIPEGGTKDMKKSGIDKGGKLVIDSVTITPVEKPVGIIALPEFQALKSAINADRSKGRTKTIKKAMKSFEAAVVKLNNKPKAWYRRLWLWVYGYF